MRYRIEMTVRALRDLRGLDRGDARRVLHKLVRLEDDLSGDVSRLTDFQPEFRLRVGDHRVLFDLEGSVVVVRRILHRSRAYDR